MSTSLRALTMGLAVAGLVSAAGAQSLSSVEEQLAVRLADPSGAIQSAAMLHPDAAHSRGTANRVVVSRVEAVRSDSGARLAVVTTYQYEGDITINRLVDLDSNAVLSEQVAYGLGAPVADVENDYVRQLLLADRRIQDLVAPFGGAVEFNMVPLTITDPSDPLYGRRAVRVIINTPDGFVTGVQIAVNLSDATVIVQQ